jgi:group II intron reverse transcriptase/maturase
MEPLKGKTAGNHGPGTVSTKQQRIADLARRSPEMAITTLSHHVDLAWLREAYRRTRRDGAVGVDGQTAREYEADLEANLRSLLERAKSGRYKAPPVRRVHIPKGAGPATRPIGIPTFEDKVLQRAVTMILEPIYEQDFLDCSYGFRPGRSAHQALDDLRNQIMDMKGGWVLEIDIRQFFDHLDHSHLKAFVRQRVRDGVIVRLINKWLHAGVLEDGRITRSSQGSPQGGVISPLLANLFLHEVLDKWFEHDVRPRMHGPSGMVRYADDAVMVFRREEDARRVLEVLPKRFERYGLDLHPEKTKLVRFERPPRPSKERRPGGPRPETFDFLGFTHHWGVSRRGNTVVKRRTAGSRFRRAIVALSRWCRRHRHDRVAVQHAALSQKLRGHYGYYGIPGNLGALRTFRRLAERVWRKWLNRRSAKRHMPWSRFRSLLERYPLPAAHLVPPASLRS